MIANAEDAACLLKRAHEIYRDQGYLEKIRSEEMLRKTFPSRGRRSEYAFIRRSVRPSTSSTYDGSDTIGFIEDAPFLCAWFRNVSHFRRSKLTGHGCKLPNDRLSRRWSLARRGAARGNGDPFGRTSAGPRIRSGMKTRK